MSMQLEFSGKPRLTFIFAHGGGSIDNTREVSDMTKKNLHFEVKKLMRRAGLDYRAAMLKVIEIQPELREQFEAAVKDTTDEDFEYAVTPKRRTSFGRNEIAWHAQRLDELTREYQRDTGEMNFSKARYVVLECFPTLSAIAMAEEDE